MADPHPKTLKDKIRQLISDTGPLGIDAYMELCLTDPDFGYYVTRDPLGKPGDFITAPEISQMFGEVIGAWCAHMWVELGQPSEFALVEPGPGRGTLMHDILRTANLLPGFQEAARIILIEASPVLQAQQKSRLEAFADKIEWQDEFSALPDMPMILVANEFIDALPIRQLQRSPAGWSERGVSIDDDDNLAWIILDGPDLEPLVSPSLRQLDEDTIIEIAPQRNGIAAMIGHHLGQHAGVALIIDYGYDNVMPGDSFQAVKSHEFANPLEDPGNADLTAHVDFSSLAKAASAAGGKVWGPLPQGTFLEQLGIVPRAEQIMAANPDRKERITRDLARLTASDQMGMLFKAMVIASPNLSAPAPFPPAPPAPLAENRDSE
ncbi:MAG: SAM-dependent methyltransferase [Rhizobiales bacterium]|nr:SAM-dependent methyltransferase [Hyphomicrobiales bacterium]